MAKILAALGVWLLAAASVGLVLGMPVAALCFAVGLPTPMCHMAWLAVAALVGFKAVTLLDEI